MRKTPRRVAGKRILTNTSDDGLTVDRLDGVSRWRELFEELGHMKNTYIILNAGTLNGGSYLCRDSRSKLSAMILGSSGEVAVECERWLR